MNVAVKEIVWWMKRTFNKLSTLEKVHFHRNFGILYLLINIFIQIKFFGFIWYSNSNLITSISPLVFYLYSFLALILPLSAFVQFMNIIGNREMRTNHGNSFDTIYSDFFVQWQAMFVIFRTMPNNYGYNANDDGIHSLVNNGFFDFFMGILIPQTLYRYFRPSKKAGVRNVTSDDYNVKEINDLWAANDHKTIAYVKKLQTASQMYQTYGYCGLKWFIIGFTFVIIYYGESCFVPKGMLNLMHELCLMSSCYEPLYPFMYTLKHKGVLNNEYVYWTVWSYMDFMSQIVGCTVACSFILNSFFYCDDIWQLPFIVYFLYFGFILCGVWLNITANDKHVQDVYLVGIFGALMIFKRVSIE